MLSVIAAIFDLSPTLNDSVIALVVAAVPGIIVALFTNYLNVRREDAQARRLIANARVLLGMELENNRQALDTFWREINGMDKEGVAEAPQSHLAGMAAGGLLDYAVPRWSFTRWERIFPQVVATLEPKQVAEIDQIYRDLRAISELFEKLVTLTPEERQELDRDRFWYNRYAGWRGAMFERLSALVTRASALQNPMASEVKG